MAVSFPAAAAGLQRHFGRAAVRSGRQGVPPNRGQDGRGLVHAAQVAIPGDANSPHLTADKIRAAVYVAGAIEDNGFTEEHAALLDSALTSAGVPHTVEIWPGHHGFAVADQPVHDAALEERHWEALRALYGENLP